MFRKRDSIIPVRKLSRHGIIVYLLTDAKQISTASDQGSEASLAEGHSRHFCKISSGSVIAIFDKAGEILTGCAPQKRSAATRSRIDNDRLYAAGDVISDLDQGRVGTGRPATHAGRAS
jgi:hypothetical protein